MELENLQKEKLNSWDTPGIRFTLIIAFKEDALIALNIFIEKQFYCVL